MADGIDLSIVLTGRNDDYGGDFNTRLLRTLRFNWAALRYRGVSCEIVFVEWNPIEGRPTLVDIARAELAEIEPDRFRGYIVDRRYQAACSLNPKLDYLEYLAKNVGIRRTLGRMVLVTNTDIFFSRCIIDALAGHSLDAGIVYRAARIDLALGSDQSRVTWEGLDDPGAHARRPTLKPPLFAGGSGDFLLLDRESWHQLRGFNEVFRVARVGIDHNFLVKAYGCGYSIVDLLSPVYHVNHQGSYRISKTLLDGNAAEAAWGKQGWPSRTVVYDNPENWGLREAPERELPGGTRYLDFDWRAVPPVADLRRVVLALRRSEGAAADAL
jgi:hypothetical protein